jgi:hypothetical protein
LLGHAGLDQAAGAMGAGLGQAGFVDLVDLVRLRRWAMPMRAVLGAGLASRGLGLGFGRPLAEGGGLAFGGPAGLVELAAEVCNLGGQRLDLALLFLDEFPQFLIARRTLGHAE